MVGWHKRTIPGPTPHGGTLATVYADADHETIGVTEYDDHGFVIRGYEWQTDHEGDGHAVTLTVTDWDEQVVERRMVSRLPAPPVDRDDLRELFGDA